MTEVVTVGGAVVDYHYALSNLPAPDGGAYVRDETEAVGGIAANLADALSRLGRDAGIVTRLGDDDRADTVERELLDRGIDTSRVRRGEEPSTYSLVLRADGERMVVTGGRSAAALEFHEADRPYLASANAVAATAYTPDRYARPLVAARADGEVSRLSFDLSGPLTELHGRGTEPETIDSAVAASDLFLAGEVATASYLDHHDAEDPISLLRERGVDRAALTHGEAGATLITPDDVVEIEAFDVATTDPTGAGDAFHAGLLDAWILEGRSPRAAGRFAAAVAALNCTANGARGGLPTREAVETFLAEQS